ncbi:hypothetical protein CYMTET_50035 [Cymbomonas tetramitiformis]|uniref:Uncharacterized protein n=1 Tax=Cymbomonas tetramitiformis TaxID=36881 RepID=A0AAE0ET98_9CHLO|nr:hypothetical protein CYMTET_50035 [Cymbomonas tetramitiformis]
MIRSKASPNQLPPCNVKTGRKAVTYLLALTNTPRQRIREWCGKDINAMTRDDIARLVSSLVSEIARDETSIAKLASDPSTAWDFVASVLYLPKEDLLQLIEYKEDDRANNARKQGGHWQLNREVHALLKKRNPLYEHHYGQVCTTLEHILNTLAIRRAGKVAAQADAADSEQADSGDTQENRDMSVAGDRSTVGHSQHSSISDAAMISLYLFGVWRWPPQSKLRNRNDDPAPTIAETALRKLAGTVHMLQRKPMNFF